MKREPVRVRAIVAAVVQLLAVLGVAIPADVSASVTVLIVAAIPLVTWIQAEIARRKVTPVTDVADPVNRRR